jgi:hypothetical protein
LWRRTPGSGHGAQQPGARRSVGVELEAPDQRATRADESERGDKTRELVQLAVVATTRLAGGEHDLAAARATWIGPGVQVLLAAAAQSLARSTATRTSRRQREIEQATPQLASQPMPVPPSGKHALVDRQPVFPCEIPRGKNPGEPRKTGQSGN